MLSENSVSWPHAPPHFTKGRGAYMVTSGTYLKRHIFRGADRLKILHGNLLELASKYDWELQAWAVFSNHYHFVGSSPTPGAGNLSRMISHLHSSTARAMNQLDSESGRKIWHNYRETHLTYDTSYYARLNYVLQNPVKHKLVLTPELYPWCSASWFSRKTTVAFQNTVKSFPCDRVKVDDDYDVYGAKGERA